MSTSARRAHERGGSPYDAPGEAGDELSTVFPSVAPSAASARRFVAAALGRWGCPEGFRELVLLLTSELVTNAYRHARSDTRVSVRYDRRTARVEVRDVGPGEPRLRPLDADRVDGRGLQIVDALADRWGYRSNDAGTTVWFELARPEQALGSLGAMVSAGSDVPAADGFRVSVHDEAGHPRVVVEGEVDVATAPALRDELYRLIEQGSSRIVVDLAGMDFIDSTGLGVFVGALKRAREGGGTIELRGLQPSARKVFDITGLSSAFTIAG